MKVLPSTSLFRRIDIPADVSTVDHGDRVIKAERLDAAQRRRCEIEVAEREAADIVAEARMQAESLGRSMRQAAEKEYALKLASLESQAAAHLDNIAQNLGEAIAVSVESIYRSIFDSDPTLLITATTEIARHILEEEVGCAIHINLIDRSDDSIKALAERFEIHTTHHISQGELLIRGDHGAVRVNARKLITDLGQDLRQCFRRVTQTLNN
ncbi:MAG: hypothetical protein JWQ11_4908 [Rhizobacter sp.]|nr:hypothetical protein [Rhizobacter sp.]